MNDLKEIICNLIESKKEGDYWDFKREPHSNKADLLHDIICMANSLYSGDRFIIIGVNDEGEIIGLQPNQPNRKKQSDLLDFLKAQHFAGDIRPEVELKTIFLENAEIDVIIIADKPEKPYWLTQSKKDDKKEVRAYYIYSRVGDRNTPKDKSEDLYWVEKMWRQRFGLDNPPMKRMEAYLRKPSDWFKDIGNVNYCYHQNFPEFRIEFSKPEEIREVFSYYYPNEKSFLGKAIFKYHTTVLFELNYIYCDEMRVIFPDPNLHYMEIEGENWFYYYDLSTLKGAFLLFLTNETLNFESGICQPPFLIFNNKDELQEFETYLIEHYHDAEVNKDNPALKRVIEKLEQELPSRINPIFLEKVKKVYQQWKKVPVSCEITPDEEIISVQD